VRQGLLCLLINYNSGIPERKATSYQKNLYYTGILDLEVEEHMARPKKFDHAFKPEGKEPLSRRQLQVKVPLAIADALNQLPSGDRSKWLRQVITEAVERELIKTNQSAC